MLIQLCSDKRAKLLAFTQPKHVAGADDSCSYRTPSVVTMQHLVSDRMHIHTQTIVPCDTFQAFRAKFFL